MSTKISALPVATIAAAADVVPVVQGGATKKVAVSLLRAPPIADAAIHGAPRILTLLDHYDDAPDSFDVCVVGGDRTFDPTKAFNLLVFVAQDEIQWTVPANGAATCGLDASLLKIVNGKGLAFLDGVDTATLPTTGRIRIPYNGGGSRPLVVVKDSGGADKALITFGAGDAFVLGAGTMSMSVLGYDILIESLTSPIDIVAQGAPALTLTSAEIKCGQPIHGNPAASSPNSVHGAIDVNIAGANHVLTAAEYAREFIRIAGNAHGGGPYRVNLPTVTDDAHAYYKYLYVGGTVDLADPVVFTAKDDTTDDLSLAPGASALVCVDATYGLRKLANLAFTP